jgi:putative salt-induced outer membrane protein
MASLPSIAAAQAADSPEKLDDRWHGSVSLGAAAASGNNSSLTVSAAADTSKANTVDKISLSGLVNYGRSDASGEQTTTADQAWVRGRYDYNLTPVWFGFGGVEAETNRVAGLRSRYGVNGGVGYKLIRNETTSFDLFGGVGYSGVEYTDDSEANGFELLWGEESTHKLSDTTTFKQRFVFRPGQGDLGNLATFNAGLATAITGAWTLNLGLQVQYASKVPVGVETTDTLFTAGFGYKF